MGFNHNLKTQRRCIVKQIISWILVLVGLFSGSELFAQTVSTRRYVISALAFDYFQGTAQYLDTQGLVEGASTSPSLTGIANVAIPGGSVMTNFSVCGGDNASDQEFSANLLRKSTLVTDPTFSAPQVIAHVNSGITFASTATVCPAATIPSTMATVNNGHWTYYVELTIGDTTEVIAAKITYTCTLGGTC
jgi:hypothetical protein